MSPENAGIDQEYQHSDALPSASALNDTNALLALYSESAKSIQFVVDKIWSNAKFFTTLTSTLLTLTIGALAKGWLDGPQKGQDSRAYLLLLILPVMVILIGRIGTLNLEREYRRFLDWVSVRAKIQERLGLCNEISSKLFPDDKYLLPSRFVTSAHRSSEAFVASGLKTKDSLCYHFRQLHYTYSALALLLIAIIVWRAFAA